MANESMRSNHRQNLQSLTERDLLELYLSTEGLILEDDDSSEAELEQLERLSKNMSYPWKPGDVSAEDVFNTLEAEFNLETWQPDELAQRSHAFFGKLDDLWSTVPVQVSLSQRFAAYMPQDLLATIAQSAKRVLSSSTTLADQLVQCVQDLQLNLAEDDLFILARPYANAMRGSETELGTELATDWKNLSEMNRAKVALAIARSALDELQANGEA